MDLTENDLEELCVLARMLDRYEAEKARQLFHTSNPEEQAPMNIDRVDPMSLEPMRNIRKQYLRKGGLGSEQSMSGYYSIHDMKKYQCVHCKKLFKWTADYDNTMNDFGDMMDSLCMDCRKELRKMRTNHPEF